jgi:hypothetical protein
VSEVRLLLERQARWQADRRNLPWPEKIRMVEQIRDAIERLRSTASQDRDVSQNRDGSSESTRPHEDRST